MPVVRKGILVECDPSIRALILNIDAETHDVIIEQLDETHLLVNESRIAYVKERLEAQISQNTYAADEEEQ